MVLDHEGAFETQIFGIDHILDEILIGIAVTQRIGFADLAATKNPELHSHSLSMRTVGRGAARIPQHRTGRPFTTARSKLNRSERFTAISTRRGTRTGLPGISTWIGEGLV